MKRKDRKKEEKTVTNDEISYSLSDSVKHIKNICASFNLSSDISDILKACADVISTEEKSHGNSVRELKFTKFDLYPLHTLDVSSLDNPGLSITEGWADSVRMCVNKQLFPSYNYSEPDNNGDSVEATIKKLENVLKSKKTYIKDIEPVIKGTVAKLKIKSTDRNLKLSSAVKESISSTDTEGFTADWKWAHSLSMQIDYEIVLSRISNKELSNLKKGEIYKLGEYSNSSGKSLPIEWLVLENDTESKKVLLISNKVLLERKYNQNASDASVWEKSNIKTWLNSGDNTGFLSQIFGGYGNSMNQILSVGPSESKIFLLNTEETEKYFPEKRGRRCESVLNDEGNPDVRSSQCHNGSCWWWLRTDKECGRVPLVYADGGICRFGVDADRAGIGVRPAMWVSYSAN